jgi:hypothetical protein
MQSIDLNLPYLEAIANIRYALQHACILITKNEIHKNHSKDHLTFLKTVQRVCKNQQLNSEWAGPQLFLLKILFKKIGESSLRKIIENQSLHWILPERLINHEVSNDNST